MPAVRVLFAASRPFEIDTERFESFEPSHAVRLDDVQKAGAVPTRAGFHPAQ